MPKHTSALQLAIHGELARWTPDTHLAALQIDLLRLSIWQRGGGKGPKPKPIPRPEDKAIARLSTADLRRDRMQSGVIGTSVPIRDMKAWLERINGRR